MDWQTFGIVAVPVLAVAGAYLRQHAEFATLKAQVGSLLKEFKPNGGSTMKDDVNSIKRNVDVLGVRFDDHLKQHAGEWR